MAASIPLRSDFDRLHREARDAKNTARASRLAGFSTATLSRCGNQKGSYGITLSGSHLFWESPDHPGKGLGVYFRSAIMDGNPNPFESFVSGGIAAHGIIPGRANDSMGIGYWHYNFSDDLTNAAAPLVTIGAESS